MNTRKTEPTPGTAARTVEPTRRLGLAEGATVADEKEPWPTPDWRHWLAQQSVTLEEAVALSLGRCPRHLRRREETATSWKPVGDSFDPNRPWSPDSEKYKAAARGELRPVTTHSVRWQFPVHGVPAGSMRLATTREAFHRGDNRLPAQDGIVARVRLADFVRFAADHDWPLPDRLSGLQPGRLREGAGTALEPGAGKVVRRVHGDRWGESRRQKQKAKDFYLEHRAQMNKEQAADALHESGEFTEAKRDTIRGWLKGL